MTWFGRDKRIRWIKTEAQAISPVKKYLSS